MGIVYLNLTIFGVLGNTFLLYLYIFKFFTGSRTRHIDLIIIHLAFVNIAIIFGGGIPKTMQVWGLKSFLDASGGKTISYFQRLFWDLSLCSPFLLSVFQAITISPNSPRWAKLKTKASKYIILCCVLCWIFNLLIDIAVAAYIVDLKNSSKGTWNIGYSSLDLDHMNTIKIVIWKSVYEGVLLSLMAIASGYMMLVLYRHHHQVQHIHSVSTHRGSPEIRATKNILLLVSTYICFNTISFPFIIYIAPSRETRNWVIQVMVFFSLCYPAVSPIMLIIKDTQIHASSCIL
ncbi:vomeronasal type-1 receptor 3-like [Trichosurus vulpecula]|uniref:vomeronasal type-1 receptor 3-like n=1 Tax=Trichosurus vulpecula TaxID=9337 RepID=UPI00186AD919|nr:vomeronasal type-1 receptor 3-like [Trichosurus vulpecula]